jgi:hypothetical protein
LTGRSRVAGDVRFVGGVEAQSRGMTTNADGAAAVGQQQKK